jgi:hypothetical protein
VQYRRVCVVVMVLWPLGMTGVCYVSSVLPAINMQPVCGRSVCDRYEECWRERWWVLLRGGGSVYVCMLYVYMSLVRNMHESVSHR